MNKSMWEMFDESIENFECDDCGGDPPPKFLIPPPPRPKFMEELIKCDDDALKVNGVLNANNNLNGNSDNKSINNWNSDICEAIPILDASYHSSPTLQTSAIIAVFSLLLILVVLISSLFVWKHKRKVQNFLPCKTPTRVPHINGNFSDTGHHTVQYEDPDAHNGHRPLVMNRSHHNVEVINNSKTVHYPSGYPMTRSPPFLVCSSPGPDPYRSNDNVYEELDQNIEICNNESESNSLQSDEEFAEDELSLPGDHNLHKSPTIPLNRDNLAASRTPVSTIYHERQSSSSNSGQEHNSLLSNSATVSGNGSVTKKTNRTGGFLSGVFRHTTGKNKNVQATATPKRSRVKYQNKTLPYNLEEPRQDSLPSSSSYDNSMEQNNLMQLKYNTSSNQRIPSHYLTLDSEVERRNRINSELHRSMVPPVATIYRNNNDRTHYPTYRYPQPYYHTSLLPQQQTKLLQSRTNPRSLDRRRYIIQSQSPSQTNAPPLQITDLDSNYGYAEPIFNDDILYSTRNCGGLRQAYPTFVLPNYSTQNGHRTIDPHHHYYHHGYHDSMQQQPQQYSIDSSFGSDSGYSQHTSLSGSRCNGNRTPTSLTTPNLSLQIDSLNSTSSNNSNNENIYPTWNNHHHHHHSHHNRHSHRPHQKLSQDLSREHQTHSKDNNLQLTEQQQQMNSTTILSNSHNLIKHNNINSPASASSSSSALSAGNNPIIRNDSNNSMNQGSSSSCNSNNINVENCINHINKNPNNNNLTVKNSITISNLESNGIANNYNKNLCNSNSLVSMNNNSNFVNISTNANSNNNLNSNNDSKSNT